MTPRLIIHGLVTVATLASPGVASTAPGQTALKADRSEIVFTTRQMGVPVEGRFLRFSAAPLPDPSSPADDAIRFDVDMASVSFAAPEVRSEAMGPDWLDTRKFPQAEFRSSAVRRLAEGRYEVAGRLSIRGLSRDLLVPVSLSSAGGVATASGTFSLARGDFGIGAGAWKDPSLVANEVQVRFRVVFAP